MEAEAWASEKYAGSPIAPYLNPGGSPANTEVSSTRNPGQYTHGRGALYLQAETTLDRIGPHREVLLPKP